MTASDFPESGYNEFQITVKKDGFLVTIDPSATVTVAIVTRKDPISLAGKKVTCSNSYPNADWPNGVVTGAFESADTATLETRGVHDLQIEIIESGRPVFYFARQALNIIETV